LQDRGALFSLNPDSPNSLEPDKRPFHTLIPALVTRNGRPWLSFGVMGGSTQPEGQTEVLVNLIDFGMNLQAAGDALRIIHSGPAGPTALLHPVSFTPKMVFHKTYSMGSHLEDMCS